MIRENLIADTRSLKLIVALSCIVIVAAIMLYMIKPQYLDFKSKRETSAMLKNQIQNQEQLQKSIDETRSQIKALSLQLHGEAGSMPVNEVEAYLVGRLQELAWGAGIELLGVKPGVSKRVMSFEEISFEVDVGGEYDHIYNWLDEIGNVLGFMLVTNYQMSLTNQQNNKTALNMHVTIVFYRAADK